MPPRRPPLRLEPLEARLAPVVGAFAEAPAVPRGTGYDGVVLLEGQSPQGGSTASGALLSTGRHILTAAHCLADDFGAIDSTATNVTFHLLDGSTPRTITLTVPRSHYRIHPNYNGSVLAGSDVALLVLADPVDPFSTRQLIAPFGAQRYGLYEAGDELGQVFTTVGYGRLGTGATGSLDATEGSKHLGTNRFEAHASALRDLPAFGLAPAGATTLMWDFDNGLAANDAMDLFLHRPDLGLGAQESNPAQGDSGGPLFLGDRIAGIVSYSDGGVAPPDINTDIDRGFGEFGIATRAAAFADYIHGQTAGPADLVLDLRYQLVGMNGKRDKVIVSARRVGDNLELAVRVPGATSRYDGVYFSGPLASVRSLTLRGSDDAEIFLLEHDLGVPVALQGRGFHDTAFLSGKPGADTLRLVHFDGGAGRDTLMVQADTHFTLSPRQLLAERFAQVGLASVEVAHLRGGPSANHFTLTGWRGQAYLTGAGGADTLSLQVPRSAAQLQAQRLADAGVVRLLYRDGARGRVSWVGIETLRFEL